MFTGLIEEVGSVIRLERRGAAGKLSVRASAVLKGTKVGDSIAVNGACLTVVEMGSDHFTVDCMPETLKLTTLGRVSPGALVNLERSLALGDRLGGHLVLGHVDAMGELLSIERGPNSWEMTISLPAEVAACVAAKGSIAIDGISLTVVSVDADRFAVGIIPHTYSATALRAVGPGSAVNLEADVLARYVQRALQAFAPGGAGTRVGGSRAAGLSEQVLREQGFM
jgi:riboflavin synthase